MTTEVLTALLFLTPMVAAYAGNRLDLKPPTTAEDKALVESIRVQIAPCLKSLGLTAALLVAAAEPKREELPVVVLVVASGAHFADGYRYLPGVQTCRPSVPPMRADCSPGHGSAGG